MSIMNTVMMIYPLKQDETRIYKTSMAWKFRGLKIRGGKIDPKTGMLQDEQKREFYHDLGVL